ncbi:transcription antitermination protein NusB [Candidatus Phytoplasma solani]|uniref:transcription antitermination protein NusB n=1 Tax=Candidatus Phytoplasma solani TaxID=69896 RepID=UPI0003B7D6FD|nr:transcription antitermination protein NusB [Candidatus Phytoplasma solani]CCP88168.1 N utilization substance protein B homolog [Candidatus Phytoplasma solani]
MCKPKTNKKARLLRIEVIKLLYQYDFYDSNFDPLSGRIKTIDPCFNQIINKLQSIDEIIIKNLFNYKLNRLNKIDKAIIRWATFELLEKTTPHAIIIDEAVELTKQFCNLNDEKQHKFNNKLLDKIRLQLQGK